MTADELIEYDGHLPEESHWKAPPNERHESTCWSLSPPMIFSVALPDLQIPSLDEADDTKVKWWTEEVAVSMDDDE